MARLFDMHVHTTRGSADSDLSPEEMVQEAERLGFFGLCVTEHGAPWDELEFRRFAAGHSLVLIRAVEVDTDMGDILAFGLYVPLPDKVRASDLRDEVDRVGGFLVTAHPFRDLFTPGSARKPLLYKDLPSPPETPEEAAKHPVFGLIDAVEVANGGTSERENLFALAVAQKLGLKVTGGSDAHARRAVGRCVTVFDHEIGTEDEFMAALRRNSFYPAVLNPNNQAQHGSWLAVPEPFTAVQA